MELVKVFLISFGFYGFYLILRGLWIIWEKEAFVNTSEDEYYADNQMLTGKDATIHGLKLAIFGSILICFSVWYEECTEIAEYFGAPTANDFHRQLREEFCQAQAEQGKNCILNEK